jgi:hypothetical protein
MSDKIWGVDITSDLPIYEDEIDAFLERERRASGKKRKKKNKHNSSNYNIYYILYYIFNIIILIKGVSFI